MNSKQNKQEINSLIPELIEFKDISYDQQYDL